MIMSSAYIFGRQISPGGIPPMAEDIYFENGRFNPLYVGNDFVFPTDVVRGQYSTIMLDSRINPYMINNLPFQTAGEPAPIWTIENGVLVRSLSTPGSSNQLSCAVYIPTNLRQSIYTARTTCMFEMQLEGWDGKNSEPWFIAYQVNDRTTGAKTRLLYRNIGDAGNTSGFENRYAVIGSVGANLDYIGIQASPDYSKVSIRKIWFVTY